MANFDTIKTAIDANIKTNGTQDITGGKMNSILKQMVDATGEQLTELESNLEGNSLATFTEWKWDKGYVISSNGSIIAVSNAKTSYPVEVNRGDEIIATGNGGSTAIIAEYISDDVYIPLVVMDSEDILTYNYFAERDMKIVISGRDNREVGNVSGCIRRNTGLLDLSNKVSQINKTARNFIEDINVFCNKNQFINNAGDVSGGANNTACTDFIPYEKGSISIHGFSGASTTALLAFYDISRGFISCIIGKQYHDKDIVISETDIPKETRFIRATGIVENGVVKQSCYLSVVSMDSLFQKNQPYISAPVFNKLYDYITISGTVGRDESSDACCTDFLLYEGGDIVVKGFSGAVTTALLAYYNSQKEVLGYVNGSDKDNVLVTIPKADIPVGTAFVRASGHQGESYINLSHSITEYETIICLEHGKLDEKGKNIGVCESSDFYNNLISAHPYEIVDNTEVFYFGQDDIEYYLYDKAMNFMFKATEIVRGAKYFKVMVSSPNKIVSKPTIITNAKKVFNVAKNTAFTYEVTFSERKVIDNFDNIQNTLTDRGETRFDRGYLMFPPNYSANGEPCKLAIFCQGSGGLKFDIPYVPYPEMCEYICKEGYIVMMICGVTDYYYDKYFAPYAPSDYLDHLCTPIAMDCYKAAYDYVRRNYNVAEQCVAWSKSIGGATTLALVYRNEIPLIAIGGHAPVCDIVGEILRNRTKNYKQYYAEAFGMEGEVEWNPTQGTNESEKDYFAANIEKVKGYNPIYSSSLGLDVNAAISAEFQCPVNTRNRDSYTLLENVYKDICKLFPVPYKMWISPDDDQVSVWRPYFVYLMGRNANQVVEFRLMPNGTGGHNSTDYGNGYNHDGEEPIRAMVTPRYSDIEVEIPIAYIELVAWWRRFGG